MRNDVYVASFVGALVFALGSCRESPAKLDFAAFEFEAGRRADILYVSASSHSALISFCNLDLGAAAIEAGCKRKDPALGDSITGFTVLILEYVPWTSPPFHERPTKVPPPKSTALVSATLNENLLTSSVDLPPNWYAFFRLRAGSDDDAPILTTDHQWPLVVCGEGTSSRSCRVAFIVEGEFVEASWHHHGPIDQAELWRIATGIDAKLRTFIKPRQLADQPNE
jgi:hypothetical protein